MPLFTVPKFIEMEAKIVGPLTFKQFIFILVAIGVCVYFYFSFPFPLFVLLSTLVGGLGLALAFLNIGGIPLPTIFANFLKFLFSPRIYLWKKRRGVTTILKEVEIKKEIKDEMPLKIAKNSHLKELKTKVETKKP